MGVTIRCALVLSQAQYMVCIIQVFFVKAVDKDEKNSYYKRLWGVEIITLEYKSLLM